MLDRCKKQTQINPHFKLVSDAKRTKDISYSNGSRATFAYDYTKQCYESEPSEVIKKERVEDINIKKSSKQTEIELTTFISDVRISINTEAPQNLVNQ